jgi:PEP-CTERM motif
MRYLRFAAVAAFAISTHLSGGPVILTNNLTEPLLGLDTLSTTLWHAISFTTDNNAYTLDSVTLRMELGGVTTNAASLIGNAPAADIPEADLYSDSAGSPGALITVLTATSAYDYTLQDVNFAAAGVTLLANSTYWVVLKATSGEVTWAYPTTNNGSGVGFTDVYAFSNTSGASWTVAGPGENPDQAEVIGDLASVPEPSTLLLAGLGFLALAVSLRRRVV